MSKALFLCLFLSGFLVSNIFAAKPSYTCYRLDASKPLTIDGKLDDWPDLPILLLGQSQQVCSGAWQGPADSMARVRLTWDDQNLYFAIEVTDDQVQQKTTLDKSSSIFKQDSLQWAVDLRCEGSTRYGEGIFEYGFGVADGQPVTYRWHTSGGWPKGIAEHVRLAVSPLPGGGVIYEAAVEHAMIKPLKAAQGRVIGFNIALQDQDGQEHKTLQWTSGIADGKNPSRFGTIVFSEAQPSGGDAAMSMLISARPHVGVDGLDVRVLINDTVKRSAIDYQLMDVDGKQIATGRLVENSTQANIFAGKIQTKLLKAGRYKLHFTDTHKQLKGTFAFERSDVERTLKILSKLTYEVNELEALIQVCKSNPVELAYAQSVLTASEIFEPYIQEDLKAGQYNLVDHNVKALRHAVARVTVQLQNWMSLSDGTPLSMRLPDLDYSKFKKVGRHLMVGNDPVMLIGQMSWVWQLHKNIQKIADLGFNAFRIGYLGQDHFDAHGKIIKRVDQPWPAIRQMLRQGYANGMSVGAEMFCPDQVWKGASRRGDIPLMQFHEIYDGFVKRESKELSSLKVKEQTIEIEAQRARYVKFDHVYHGPLWQKYLSSAHHNIAQLNRLYETNYSNFSKVPYPKKRPEKKAPLYDYARFRQMMIAHELSRAAEVIRLEDPDVLVQGYPYSRIFREPGSYYQQYIDPELDTENFDIVGCDTSGPYRSKRYAMSTITWLAGYYDLMHSIAEDRPLWDGEYHYVNRRRMYPKNWSRAIMFQSYIHGLSGTYAWVWVRSPSVDCAIHLDAQVMLESGQAALELQRTAKAIAAFHDQKADVVILYANASTPHVRRHQDGVLLNQTVQTDLLYEGLFFEGLQTGFITEKQVQRGLLKDHKLLFIANSSHVNQATRDAIEVFARDGGRVVMIGDCLQFTPHGQPYQAMPSLKSIRQYAGFKNADAARIMLKPVLRGAGILPKVQLKVINGLSFPTVEWRHAVDTQGRSLLFVLNLGHDQATITLPSDWQGATDLLDGQKMSKTFKLQSLAFRMLKKIRNN